MKADIRWLDNPEIFRVNREDAHSDHAYYARNIGMKGCREKPTRTERREPIEVFSLKNRL